MQNILIVEDDIDIQDILKNHLIDAGYEVAVGQNFLTYMGNYTLHHKFKKLCYPINWRWNNAEDFNCRGRY